MAPGQVEIRTPSRPSNGYEGVKLNKISSYITQNPDKGGAQSMLHACGVTVEDLNKAQVGSECAYQCLILAPLVWDHSKVTVTLLFQSRVSGGRATLATREYSIAMAVE